LNSFWFLISQIQSTDSIQHDLSESPNHFHMTRTSVCVMITQHSPPSLDSPQLDWSSFPTQYPNLRAFHTLSLPRSVSVRWDVAAITRLFQSLSNSTFDLFHSRNISPHAGWDLRRSIISSGSRIGLSNHFLQTRWHLHLHQIKLWWLLFQYCFRKVCLCIGDEGDVFLSHLLNMYHNIHMNLST
jgi:hypothetical protein